MKRRKFLGNLGLGTMAVVAGRAMIGKQLSTSFFEEGGFYENIIVGSGYGGAVAAQRLAESGCPVLMLELGLDWEQYKQDNPDFSFYSMPAPGKESTWMNNRPQAPVELGNAFATFEPFTGILRRQDFDNVKVYMGRGIGGGSLVNGGMTVTPSREYFTQIFSDVGVTIPTDEFFDTYFPLANTELGMNRIPDDVLNSEWYKYARIGVEEGVAAGFTEVDVPNVYDFDYMREEIAGNVPGSATEIEVLYGNNYGKRDLTKTYIKRAIDTDNITILPQHRVNFITENGNGTYDINVTLIDTENNDVATKVFTAGRLYMAAGSLGTTKLLLKSKNLGTLPNVDDKVGLYWGNNGNTMCSRQAQDIVGHQNRGDNQASMPVRGLDNFDDPTYPFFAEIAPMPAAGAFSGIYLVVNKLKKFGEILYNAANDEITLDWDKTHTDHMRTNANYFLERMNAAGDKNWYGLPYANNTGFFSDNGIDETICYHPLGGVVLGQATDMYGRLNNHENLYVLDGALIPGTLGVNPYVTITAIAERNIETIIKEDCESCQRTLPVQIKNFKIEVNHRDAVISWETISETNNKQFNIQRSTDGNTFETIDFVLGKGTSTDLNTYKYKDKNAADIANTLYYRIEQVDFDGAKTTFTILPIVFDGSLEPKLYPSVISSGDQVTVTGNKIQNITIYDVLGTSVSQQTYSGQSIVKVNTNALSAGTYFVVVDYKKTHKLIIK